MKIFMTGNEAIARGAYEAGVVYASAYPGTPSTEILENTAQYPEIISEWAPNEKVALEAVLGASIAGGRALAAMKHVGVNVAADPLMTISYTGVTGGLVLISADDPGCHSSQNEQDNRILAKFAKIACVEPSDSQESLDYMKAAYEISEKYDVAVMLRMTTRVCHSKSLVEQGERVEKEIIPYVKRPEKYIAAPAHAKKLHPVVEAKLVDLEKFSNETTLNRVEWFDKKIGIVTSGVAYQYAKEVFGENASYLKLGFTNPMPMDKIRDFAAQVEMLYVIEELEPFMEDQIKAAGISCVGKEKIPNIGELNPDIIAKALLGEERPLIEIDKDKIVGRPPTLCAGCPHRGFFYALKKKKNVMVTGDIGCYTLGASEPLNTTDTVIDMGASISMGHGAQRVLDKAGKGMKVVSVIGDSTFFHSGITSLIDVVYNQGNTVNVILDNRITGMTGHQENPGTGYTLSGKKVKEVEIDTLVRALGVELVINVNPLDLDAVTKALDAALAFEGPSVIITRWPCALKKFTPEDIKEFGKAQPVCYVVEEECRGCRLCNKTGCPAIVFDKAKKKSYIDPNACVGCEVCLQVCPFHAIKKAGE
ncbi:indolepyruvate ferredoxin oxidoreductase subunit alpha [Acidaminobacter hydrogenoformans]|uniref:Indolepyruvate oxidoreductase subunit IorA n=1 Tax=Acidaminobacter hydrogenoformans DSM 2784 TaxID=1120920 RepID=A0A1G5RUZ9_9FIRM|nr:indolepyruvate ferredoxin oxidoreductase subunit alpha [Acidaminobacter hydrogenoformans]SCZ77540.1 indolepyruvate ferredoxin oxidoreductase alpha subunit [Acidaminobacter hydrogenoformans DSM 2784]